jgi:tetratricopeptide (TPR) repeat protein
MTFYQRALAMREALLGPEHRAVALSLHDLANLYCVEGRYTEAEPLYQRALAIREKILGKDHPDVATVLESYAKLLGATGRQAKAKEFEERARQIRLSAPKTSPRLGNPYT